MDMEMAMMFVKAFVIGGLICVLGQLLMDVGRLTPAHTMSTLVVLGAIADGIGIYDPLIRFAGAGVTVPITSFGNALVHGALMREDSDGFIGIAMGVFEQTSAGITAAIVFSFIASLFFRPKG